ncbi:MAG: 3-isopropylmalate dehydratase small subunit 2, partial [Fidelibacterota bacterium]
MDKLTLIEGKAWLIRDERGVFIDDIDTDQIYHNTHLAVTEIERMGQFAFGNLKGWENFPSLSERGDILIVGKNFGSGSSRQHAVDCFKSLGISLIIGQSFGAIYKRNAINSGLP